MQQLAQSYVFLEESANDSWIYPVDVLPCQFHRRVLAELMGSAEWDWHVTRFAPETRAEYSRTIAQLTPLVDEHFQKKFSQK